MLDHWDELIANGSMRSKGWEGGTLEEEEEDVVGCVVGCVVGRCV